MTRHNVRFSALLAAALLTACAGKHTARPEWLDLNGSWRLNERESDRPMADADMPEAGRRTGGQRPGGGERPPGGMPPGGGGMGGRGGRGGQGDMPTQRRAFNPDMIPPLREFRLTQTDSTIRFSFGAKRGVVVPTNGKKVKTDMWPGAPVMAMELGGGMSDRASAGETELKAEWTAEGLQLERSFGRGNIKELWSRAPDSKRLVITTEIGQRKIRRVYDLVEAK